MKDARLLKTNVEAGNKRKLHPECTKGFGCKWNEVSVRFSCHTTIVFCLCIKFSINYLVLSIETSGVIAFN